MKLLLVVPGGVTADNQGDVIPALSAFAHALSHHCEVCVLALYPRRAPPQRVTSSLVILRPGRRPLRRGGVLASYFAARRELRRSDCGYDVIHSFWLGRTSTLACLLRGRQALPWIASVGGQEFHEARLPASGLLANGLRRAANRLALARADLVTGGSSTILQAVHKAGGSARWWPLFPDTAKFRGGARTPAADGGFRLLTVADHNPAKDVPTLLQTVGLLRGQGRNVRLDWVGLELANARARDIAAELGITDCVRIHGHLGNDAIPEKLLAADLYVQSSRYESQGVSVCEAALSGLPIVGTDVGILSDMAPDAAMSVAVGDPRQLADAIAAVMDDAALRQRLATAAQAWMQDYSLDWSVEQALGMYRDLLSMRA